MTFRKPIAADDDANLKAIPRKQRAMVRKGIDRGLTSVAGHRRPTSTRCHAIYAESVRNLGTPVFPRRWFRLLAEVFADEMDVVTVLRRRAPGRGRAQLLRPRRGAALLRRRHRAGAAAGGQRLHVLGGDAPRRCDRGCRMFDFGRSKLGTGAFAFKKNWGFAPAPLLHRFRLAPGAAIPDHNPLNPKYALFIAAWKRLPLPVANLVGPHIVRGVG